MRRRFAQGETRLAPLNRARGILVRAPSAGAPHTSLPKGKTGRPPFPIATMLRIHFLQDWFGPCDPAMEEAPFDVPLHREFAQRPTGIVRLPDESTILRFRHLLEAHDLSERTLASINDPLRDAGWCSRPAA